MYQSEGDVRGIKAVSGTRNDTYVVFLDRPKFAGGGSFKLLSSNDGGKTFKPYTLFAGKLFPVFKNGFDMVITRFGDNTQVHIIWAERKGDGIRLMYTHSKDNITKWSEPASIASAEKFEDWLCSKPLITTDGLNRIVVVYANLSSTAETGYHMAYRISEDEGDSFAPETTITEDIVDPGEITGALTTDGLMHIAWDDENFNEFSKRRIFYVRGRIR